MGEPMYASGGHLLQSTGGARVSACLERRQLPPLLPHRESVLRLAAAECHFLPSNSFLGLFGFPPGAMTTARGGIAPEDTEMKIQAQATSKCERERIAHPPFLVTHTLSASKD